MMVMSMQGSGVKFFKNTLWVGVFTSMSRVLGYLRERLISHFLGVSAETDALMIAIKLPSFFRRILAEGAFSSSFVPILTECVEKRAQDKEAQFIFTTTIMLLGILLPLIGAFEIWADSIIPFVLPKLAATPTRLAYTILFSRIIFPFIFFISISSVFSSILQSHMRFKIVASAPAIGNLTLVTLGYYLLPLAHNSISTGKYTAWAVLMSGITHFLWVFWPALKFIPKTAKKLNLKSEEFKRFIKNFLPGVVGAASLQINVLVDTIFVSLLAIGGASYLAYADRVIQLPVSVISVSLSITLLPALTHAITQKKEEASQLFITSLGMCLILSIPAAIGSMEESYFIVKMLYNYGAFSSQHIAPTAASLKMFALGLPAFLTSKILATLFFAHKNTKTPARITMLSVGIGIISNAILMRYMGHVGLALGTTISAYSHLMALLWCAFKRGILPNQLIQKLMLWRIIGANGLFFAYMHFCTPRLIHYCTTCNRLVCTITIIFSAIFAYVLFCIICGLKPYWRLLQKA